MVKNTKNMRVRAVKQDFGNHISVAFLSDDNEYAGSELKIKELKEGEAVPILLQLDIGGAQKLIDDLWDCGLRPSEGSGSAGALKAVEYHLEDMRKIVFSPQFRFGLDEYGPAGYGLRDVDKSLKEEDKDASTKRI